MSFSHKAKRIRRVDTPVCCPRPPVGQEVEEQSHLVACTAVTADTGSSSRSASDTTSQAEREQDEACCPVTGVYADICDDYLVYPEVIGRGHYGAVRQCVHLATRRTFAVKSIDKSRIGRTEHLRREILLLRDVDHRGVLEMVDCYEDREFVHIVTALYAGGELFDLIGDRASPEGCLSEREAAGIIESLLEAVAYLHENGIVHRDIKPENVMFESEEREGAAVRLVDFGLSRRHADGETPMSSPVGTPYYMSPELLGGKYGKPTDVWSVGVIAYVLLSGYPPFNGRTDSEIKDRTRIGRLHFGGRGWVNKSDEAIDFVACLLRRNPRKRFTAREALAHPWIRKMTAL